MHAQPEGVHGDDLEAAVEAAISACDGDVRAAVRALMVANNAIQAELDHVRDFYVSSGFSRGLLRLRDLP